MELLGRKWNGAETARSWRVPNMDEEGESPLGNGFGYPTEDLSVELTHSHLTSKYRESGQNGKEC